MQIAVYFTNRKAQVFDVANVVFHSSGTWFSFTNSRQVQTTREVEVTNENQETFTVTEERTAFPELIGAGKVVINWAEVAYVQEYVAPDPEQDPTETATGNESLTA